jgi:hypothetical protein
MSDSSLVVRLIYYSEQHLSIGFRRPCSISREGITRIAEFKVRARDFFVFFGQLKMNKNTNRIALFQTPFRQFILVQSQIMTQLMQKSCVNFVPKNLLIALGKIPDVFQK